METWCLLDNFSTKRSFHMMSVIPNGYPPYFTYHYTTQWLLWQITEAERLVKLQLALEVQKSFHHLCWLKARNIDKAKSCQLSASTFG